ncbi:hypothetical protein GGG16DRAFT_86264 [Schizophyllum commune]
MWQIPVSLPLLRVLPSVPPRQLLAIESQLSHRTMGARSIANKVVIHGSAGPCPGARASPMLSQPSPSPSSSASTSTSTTASTSTAPAQTDIDFLDLSDDEESEEMYPFNYYPDEVMPRRRHACCARCTNELQTFDFDDDDSDRGAYINIPSPSANYRIILDILGGVKREPGPAELRVAVEQKHDLPAPRLRRAKSFSSFSSRVAGLAHTFAKKLRPKRIVAH